MLGADVVVVVRAGDLRRGLTTAIARWVYRLKAGLVVQESANRVSAACLLTPRTALISTHDFPAPRARSTKNPSAASHVLVSSLIVVAAVASCSSSSLLPASALMVSMSCCRSGPGVMPSTLG